jgi:hypothetical protein
MMGREPGAATVTATGQEELRPMRDRTPGSCRRHARAAWTLAIGAAACSADAGHGQETRDLVFTADCGREFPARLVVPGEDVRNGWGVLMIGGGIGNDLDWTTPGALEIGGEQRPVTISGLGHADAPRIASALAARGFTVMHWSTIARDDPKRDRWPYEATTYPMDEQVEHARVALRLLRAEAPVGPGRVVLLGHSLGAARACAIAAADDGVAGLVLLGAAQVTRTGPDDRGRALHRRTVARLVATIDGDGDGTCSAAEFAAARDRGALPAPLAAQEFIRLDFDHDGALRAWELAAGLARRARQDIAADAPGVDGAGLPWSEDVLARRPLPTLVVYGALDDAQAHHAPIIAERIEDEPLRHVELVVVPDVGHQLGPERDGRIGPVDERVTGMIARWLAGVAARDG